MIFLQVFQILISMDNELGSENMFSTAWWKRGGKIKYKNYRVSFLRFSNVEKLN